VGSNAEPHPRAGLAHRGIGLGVLVLVAGGGALGSLARVGVGRVLSTSPRFPWATFAVNVAGAFVLAALAVLVLERGRGSRALWLATATGFCGAFTTLSTVVVQVDLDVRAGDGLSAVLYGLVTLAAGVAAVLAGTALARWVWRQKDDLGHGARSTRGSTPWN